MLHAPWAGEAEGAGRGGEGRRGEERGGEGERRPSLMAVPSWCLQQCSMTCSGVFVSSVCLHNSAYHAVVSESNNFTADILAGEIGKAFDSRGE